MASVPRVPGLNRTQLVNVGIFGEALTCMVLSYWRPKKKSQLVLWELWWGVGARYLGGSNLSLPPRFPVDGI